MKDIITITRPAADLKQLASAINAEHAAAVTAIRTSCERAAALGELLSEAKRLCKHGEWIPWLGKNCPAIEPRQVQRYMRIAKKWPELQASNASLGTHLTINGAIEVLSTPVPVNEDEPDQADDGVASDPDDNPYQRDNQPAKRPATIAEQTPREPTTIPLASPAARQEGVKDARGRVVPKNLEPLFIAGRELKKTVQACGTAIEAGSMEPWGKALIGTIEATMYDFGKVKEAVRCGVPYVVCPHVGDDGEHDVSGKCKTCDDWGWVARGWYEQFTEELKAACDDRAEKNAEREAA